ncbi:hypothetical protein QP551_07095 [Slackia exigua]|uniref:hypothetical protein n=1 Tax=Slackia exigua TaxID=84109 RepID=UPI00254B3D40|nr:hypothetical protein [Slackia exigua]MDK7724457.1 hypothetical protein [Slackia exigua]MDK7726168.1 hypothetical protein [Slackia exigua]
MIPFVPAVVPNVPQALVLVIVFSLVLAPYMRKHAGTFYLGFLAFSLASFLPAMDANPAFKTIVDLFASCYTGVAFYLVVMFIGALPKRWQAVRRLLAARSELSVIGGIVICAHVVKVVFMVPLSLTFYWGYIWGDAAPYMLLACTVIGVPLLVCFLVPWITSFKAVRKKMRPATWKRVQKLAYPFMALLIAQGILLGVGHAVYVGTDASEFPTYVATSVTYAVMGIAYLALKLHMRFSSSHAKD